MINIDKAVREYSVDSDPSGAWGLYLADEYLKKYGSIEATPTYIERFGKGKSALEMARKVLESTNPKKIYHSSNMMKDLRGVFSKIRKTGFKLEKIRDMNEIDMWNYYMRLRKELIR